MLTVAERAQILAMAASRPDAPESLQAASDAVLDGAFTWTDVVRGQCAHPVAVTLFMPDVLARVGPVVRAATTEYQAGRTAPPNPQPPETDDEYFAEDRFLED